MTETNEISVTIPGVPIAKARPRFRRVGKFVNTYNPQESEEGKFICLLQNNIKRQPIPAGVPIYLSLMFYMPIPKSMSKKEIASGPTHTKKPDIDNCIKFFMDCANGIIWHDDSQVVNITATKMYADYPGTYIHLVW